MKKVAIKKGTPPIKLRPVSLTFTHFGFGVAEEKKLTALQAVREIDFAQDRSSHAGTMMKSATPLCCELEFVDLGAGQPTRWRVHRKNIMVGSRNPDEVLLVLKELGFRKNSSGTLKHKVLKNSPGIILCKTQEDTNWHIGVNISRMCRVCDMKAKFPNLTPHVAKLLTEHKNVQNAFYSSASIHGLQVELICGDPQTGHQELTAKKITSQLSRSRRLNGIPH